MDWGYNYNGADIWWKIMSGTVGFYIVRFGRSGITNGYVQIADSLFPFNFNDYTQVTCSANYSGRINYCCWQLQSHIINIYIRDFNGVEPTVAYPVAVHGIITQIISLS